ncbi:hypothetical protein FDECE_17955, partial [Fusarium decemcellulare]
MSDTDATDQPRRSERVKATRTPTAKAQSLPVRPSLQNTGSPVKQNSRRHNLNDGGTSSTSGPPTSHHSARTDSEATSRASRDPSNRANTWTIATSAQHSKSLSDYQAIFDRPPLPSCRSSPSRQSSASKRSTSPLKNMASLREAGIEYDDLKDNGARLGDAGDELHQDLTDITMSIGIYPAQICEDIHVAIERKRRIHQLHKNMGDPRSRQDLLHELSQLQE